MAERGAEAEAEVLAAGGVAMRAAPGGSEVLVVHRPRYDDWSFPKGKLAAGEGFGEAARREVEEETGVRCALGGELSSVRYRDRHGRRKLVRYWRMRPEAGDPAEREPDDEVDAARWVAAAEAAELLTYAADRGLLQEVLG